MRALRSVVVAAALALGSVIAAGPASAAPVGAGATAPIEALGSAVETVQYGYYGPRRHYRPRHHWGPRRYYGRPYGYYRPRYYRPRYYAPRYYRPRVVCRTRYTQWGPRRVCFRRY